MKLKKDDPQDMKQYQNQMGCFHDRRKERELFEKPLKEKFEACERFKNEGNEHFKLKNFEKADIEYQKALLQLDYSFPDKPEEDKKMQELQEALYGNMATLKYQLKDFDDSIHNANLVTHKVTQCGNRIRLGS